MQLGTRSLSLVGEGWWGFGSIYGPEPSPGSHLSITIDLSHKGEVCAAGRRHELELTLFAPACVADAGFGPPSRTRPEGQKALPASYRPRRDWLPELGRLQRPSGDESSKLTWFRQQDVGVFSCLRMSRYFFVVSNKKLSAVTQRPEVIGGPPHSTARCRRA